MIGNNIKAVESEDLSINGEDRYVIVDIETGEILDDANGYGYKSAKNAYAAYAYKNRSKEENEKEKVSKENLKKFFKEHKKLIRSLEDELFYALKDGDKIDFNSDFIKSFFKENNIEFKDLGFTPKQFKKFFSNSKF